MTIVALARRIFRTIGALALAVGLLAAPAGHSASHDPLMAAASEAERHAALAMEITEHGHSHDDGDGDEQSPGHSHGHDPSDHLHDKAGAPPVFVQTVPATSEVRLARVLDTGRDALAPAFKRPPRSVFAA